MTNKELFEALCEKIAEGSNYNVTVSRNLSRDVLTFFDEETENRFEIDFSGTKIEIYTC